MKKPFKEGQGRDKTFSRLIGMGENSLQKSYYPQLQKKIKELEKSEHRYRLLAEHITDVIWLMDLNCHFRYISPSIETMSGYRYEDLVDRSVDALLTPESTKLFFQTVTDLLEVSTLTEWETARQIEVRQKNASGDVKWLEVVVSAFFNEIKNEKQLLCVARDIERRKANEKEKIDMQQQLLHSQKMESIGTLAGGIAHDFNNLLTVINGYADLALGRTGDQNILKKELNAIKEAGKRAEALTRQLLAFSRKQIYRPSTVDINQTIRRMDKILRRLIGEDIHVEMILADKVDAINADASQLDQIFTNLVVNARDALKKIDGSGFKKKITIETGQAFFSEEARPRVHLEQPGSYVFFSVSDNGVGMPKELLSRIFEPFFTTKAKYEGTGLGLSMIYGIVRQNKGTIQVYSEPDKGTMFKIYWPVSGSRIDSDDTDEDSSASLSGSETILLVEDDPDVCHFASAGLKSLGYDVIVAYDGEKALEMIVENKIVFDLIVTDLVMPNLNGKEFVNKVWEVYPKIPVIYVSGYTDNHIVHDGILEPGVNFLQKPYNQQSLAGMVRSVLDQPVLGRSSKNRLI